MIYVGLAIKLYYPFRIYGQGITTAKKRGNNKYQSRL